MGKSMQPPLRVMKRSASGHAYGTFAVASLCLLSACGLQRRQEAFKLAADAARECMLREAPAIAAIKVDLETATNALLGRCGVELLAERQALLDEYPGFREVTEPKARELTAMRVDLARQTIAVMRTRQ
jgi:hypothetical protein